MVLLDNPFTPNGGIIARFPFAAEFFGIDPVTQTAQSGQSEGLRFNSGFLNVALGYNPSADSPASFNPISWANSFTAGLLPTYLLGGFDIKGASLGAILANLAGLILAGSTFTSYSTVVPNDLPLLEPMRLPAPLFNLASYALGSDLRLSAPVADALQPAFEIMVNTGYTDVQTPSEGGTYNRTYDKSAVPTPLWTEAPLTLQESLAVPGDVLQALWDGTVASVQNLIANGLFYTDSGLLAPAAAVPAPTAATLAKVQPRAAASSEVDGPEVKAVSDDITPIRSKAGHSQKVSPAAAAAESDEGATHGNAPKSDHKDSSKRGHSSRRAG